MAEPRESDALTASKPSITATDGPQPIGVPAGYLAPGIDIPYFERGGIGPTTVDRVAVAPSYFEGSDWEPAGRTPNAVADLQQAMVDAGVLSKTYHRGVWDDASRAAYRDVLGFANGAGITDIEAIRRWGEAPKVEGDEAEFKALPFRKPDPATVRRQVKAAFADVLPRDLRDNEIDYLASQLDGMLAQEHAADEGARRAQFDGAATAPQAVDAESRFRELLDTRYRPQVDFAAEQEETADSKAFLGKSLSSMSRMIGGNTDA